MEEGINTRLNKIENMLEETVADKRQEKKSKLERKLKLTTGKKKRNYVVILKINENRDLEIVKEPIQNQSVTIDGVPRLATGEHVLNYKKEPILIQPSWSVEPFAPSKHFKESLEDGSNTRGYSILLARMKEGAISAKKNIGWGLSIGMIIILGVLAYGLFAG